MTAISHEAYSPIKHFPILEPPNPYVYVSELHNIRQNTHIEALKY